MSRDPEQVVDLRDVTALDADAAGHVYALQRQDDGQVKIVVLDGRQEVLEAQQRQGSLEDPARITSPAVSYVVRTQPAIDFDVRGLHVAPSGLYLLLHGTSCQDSSIVTMAVVDLHGGQPTATGARGVHATRLKSCRLHRVDPVLFGSRPGLLLYQVSWHPQSEEHLVMLTSDNRLRLYRVTHTLAAAEQTLHVVLAAGRRPQRYGLSSLAFPGHLGAAGGGARGETPPSSDVVAFAFGPAVGWGLFSLLLLAEDGHIYCLGPVAPFGMRCAAALLERLVQEDTAAAEWLKAAFGADALQDPATKNRWQVLPHVVEGVSPAVVGPLNPRVLQEASLVARATSLAVSHTLTGTTGGSGGSPSSVSTAIVGSAEGRMLAYAIAGTWVPAWCESAPLYMSVTGTPSLTPSAVRYKCTLRASGNGMGPGITTITTTTTSPATAAAPSALLLDIVELPPALPGRGSNDGGAAAAPSDTDDDMDAFEDDYGLSASAIAAARCAMSIHVQAGVAGGSAIVMRTGAHALASITVWICQRSSGCWRITLPWSGMLAQWLAEAAGPSQVQSGDSPPSELPVPLVRCVYDAKAASQGSTTPAARNTLAGGAAPIGSCLLLNPLLGGGLLLLTAAGVLHYFQPAGAASLIMEQQQKQRAVASPHDPQQRTPDLSSTSRSALTPGRSPEHRNAQVEAHIKSMYGNLMMPPSDRNLPEPPAGASKPLSVTSSEGLVHLTDCIAGLRGKHLAFLHGAAVDLLSRADALRAEGGKHAAAVNDLTKLAIAVEGRQEALEARLSRIKLLHDNLVERAGMLASLHWSLPRALSRAEVATAEELSVGESRLKSLQVQWNIMSARARRLCEQRRSRGSELSSMFVTGIPEGQIGKVQDAVMAQSSGIVAARSALSTLERLVTTAAADQAAEQLDEGLDRAELTN